MIGDDIKAIVASLSRRSVIQGAAAIPVIYALGTSGTAAAAGDPPQGSASKSPPSAQPAMVPGRKLNSAERVARNLHIAEKFYDAYHNSPERGELIGAFDKDDFADGWMFCSPFLGGEIKPNAQDMAKGANANNKRIRARLPGYRMEDFAAWPTDWGCSWRWRVTGHPVHGDDLYEFWEMLFIWTNDEGKITRFEFFDDWYGFAASTAYAWEQSLDTFTKIKNYGKAPWTPPPVSHFHPPVTPAAPPASKRAARNLEIAQKFYDAFHSPAGSGPLPKGPFLPEDFAFAEGCVMFSPASGERKLPVNWEGWRRKTVDHRQIAEVLPDYKMDQFAAWPTDDGCAWRWLVNGHSKTGVYYEFWEQIFIRTNDAGKITRFEFFDDFLGFPQMLGFVTGVSLEDRSAICDA